MVPTAIPAMAPVVSPEELEFEDDDVDVEVAVEDDEDAVEDALVVKSSEVTLKHGTWTVKSAASMKVW